MSATDPRDYVFSLLGILDQNEAKLVTPDYDMTCGQVFAKATYANLFVSKTRKTSPWKTLNRARLGFRDSDPSMNDLYDDMPSWAVDFSKPAYSEYSWTDPVHSQDNSWFFGNDSAPVNDDSAHLPNGTHISAYLNNFWPKLQIQLKLQSGSVPQLITSGAIFDRVSNVLRLRNLRKDKADKRNDDTFALQVQLFTFVRKAAQKAISSGTFVSTTRSSSAFRSYSFWYAISCFAEGNISVFKPKTLHFALLFWYFLVGLQETTPDIRYGSSTRRLLGFIQYYTEAIAKRSHVFATDCGFLGVAPATICPGDAVVVLPECRTPVILRPCGDSWTFQGLAWVYGLMPGEVIERVQRWNFEEKSFTLI